MKLFRSAQSQQPREGVERTDGAPGREDGELEDGGRPERVIAGERGISSINRARPLQSRVTNALAMGLMSALGVGLLGWYYAHAFARQSQGRRTAQAAASRQAQGDLPLPPLGPIDPPATATPSSAVQTVLGSAPPLPAAFAASAIPTAADPVAVAAVSPAGTASPPTKTPQQLALERKLSGPAFDSQPDNGSANVAPPPASVSEAVPSSAEGAVPVAGGGAATNRSATSALAGLLTPTVTAAATPTVLPTQRLLLPKGAFIDCTLETAVDSTLPGMTTCITATDTFGADGTTVLMERGTKLVGETRGEVQQGSARVFVLWTEARTPTGVVIPLASAGTDELGRAGLSGDVNRHFWQRFGAAILISLVSGGEQYAVQSQSKGGTVIYDPSATEGVMTESLKSTVDIPPTVTVANGSRIQVLVARDLDFRSVYELRPSASR